MFESVYVDDSRAFRTVGNTVVNLRPADANILQESILHRSQVAAGANAGPMIPQRAVCRSDSRYRPGHLRTLHLLDSNYEVLAFYALPVSTVFLQ
jgi:hypothetical protein